MIGIRRIYRATVDGFSSDEYLSKVSKYKNLLTVVKTADGSVLGGYVGFRLRGEYGEYDEDNNPKLRPVPYPSRYKYREYINRPDNSYNPNANYVYGRNMCNSRKCDPSGLDPYFRDLW